MLECSSWVLGVLGSKRSTDRRSLEWFGALLKNGQNDPFRRLFEKRPKWPFPSAFWKTAKMTPSVGFFKNGQNDPFHRLFQNRPKWPHLARFLKNAQNDPIYRDFWKTPKLTLFTEILFFPAKWPRHARFWKYFWVDEKFWHFWKKFFSFFFVQNICKYVLQEFCEVSSKKNFFDILHFFHVLVILTFGICWVKGGVIGKTIVFPGNGFILGESKFFLLTL